MSRSVAERVVLRLQLARDREFIGLAADAPDPPIGLAVEHLRAKLTAWPEPDTHLLRIVVRDRDAVRAARLANAVAEAYVESAISARLDAQRHTANWLLEQRAAATDRLENAEHSLELLGQREDAPALPFTQQQALLTDEITQLQLALTQKRLRRIELAARVTKLTAAQHDNPLEPHTIEIDSDSAVSTLRAERRAVTARLRELPVSAETYQAGQRHLSAITEQLVAAVDGVIASSRRELLAAQNEEDQLRQALERANAMSLKLQRQRISYEHHERERQESSVLRRSFQERYDALFASDTTLVSTRIVDAAVTPSSPELPLRRWLLLAGAFCALLALAVMRVMTARRGR